MTSEMSEPLSTIQFYTPDWHPPQGVQSVSTLRQGGVSKGVFESLNLGAHVGDDVSNVIENRRRLLNALKKSVRCLSFVNQVHGTRAVLVEKAVSVLDDQSAEQALLPTQVKEADALVTSQSSLGLLIQTADCLPVFFSSTDGRVVGIAHAGWRGLATGVLENTVSLMRDEGRRCGASQKVIATFGPAIGPQKFEVGAEVRAAFVGQKNGLAELFFKPSFNPGKFFANLYGLASLRLGLIDVEVAGQCRRCTVSEPESFFSYRRDGQTGRQASVIWIS
jgi:polyphenol oxidase